MFGLKSYIYLSLFLFSLLACQVFAGELSPSTEVQENMTILLETKNCPQCNLSGADLNRMDLSEANLEGANLSRAKMSLTNLSGANLRNTDLREAVFYGADLANIDLRGADLTGAKLGGAYIVGALMDGEMVVTKPYEQDDISDIEETVYVEDTVNPKAPQQTEEMTIGSRRDFEETPPVVPEKKVQTETVKSPPNSKPVENVTLAYDDESLPKQSPAAPDAKVAPAIQIVSIDEKLTENEVLLTDDNKKQPSTEATIEQVYPEQDGVTDSAFLENNQTQTANDGDQESREHKETVSTEMSSISGTEELVQVPQTVPPSTKGNGTDGPADNDQDKVGEISESENAMQTVSTDLNVEDQPAGMVQTVLNLFSSDEPSTEILKNVTLLLDTNGCYGCNLAGVDLSGKNLDSADLENADLSNAILIDVDLEGANLKEANLTGADLSGADLSGADLYKANLTDADLTDADLEDTLLDYVNFSGVKGYKKQTMMLME